MRVPLLDLQAQYVTLRTDLLEAVTRVCDSQQFILGPEVETLERELATAVGVEHAVAVSSGSDALLVALMALGVGPGAEVITSDYSFFASAGCIARLGAQPVFVDIDPRTFNIDPRGVAAAITPRTRAIIPVHLFGQTAEMTPILAAAEAHGVPVVEDAAQAIGAQYCGRQAGSMGTVGCFSFFPSKNLGAFGDGGLVVTGNPQLARELRLLRNHGAEPKYHHQRIGGNFRLDALQAAVLSVKLPHLRSWTESRRRHARFYRDALAPAVAGGLQLPQEIPEAFHIYNQFVVRAPDRDALKAHLATCGVGSEVYYPVPFHRQACFANLPAPPCPHSESAAATSLAIPVYPELTAAQLDHVAQSINGFFGCVR